MEGEDFSEIEKLENDVAVSELLPMRQIIIDSVLKTKLACFAKRTLDIMVALIGVIALIPITVVIYFANLILGDHGPVFYSQERIGQNGKKFKMYKFRSMVVNAEKKLADYLKENEDAAIEYKKYHKLTNDPRITKIGKFIRKTSIDEFPQFINVLKGEMSIVGPRPYLPRERGEMNGYYQYITEMRPGVTGYWQVSNKRLETISEKVRMDMAYYTKRTLKLDIKILLITMLLDVRNSKLNIDIEQDILLKSNLEIWVDVLYTFTKLFIKRIIDILASIVGLAFMPLFMFIVFIGNRMCNDKGPLFYSHERIGKNGEKFRMYKFRSMVVGADDILKEYLANNEEARREFAENRKLKDDPRITKIGRFIRQTSIDEFPQFLNVLKGEMSLIGPRAVVDDEIEKFGDKQEKVLSVKPGITGYWAANGRSSTSYDERVKMESFYADNYSMLLDTKILFKTVISVLKKEGAV